VKRGGKVHRPEREGSIEIPDEAEARHQQQLGAIGHRLAADGGAEPEPAKGAGDEQKAQPGRPEDPAEADRQIAGVIQALDPGEEAVWTSGGKPDAQALSEKLGWRVSAEDRDRVWAAVKPAAGE
jgi:hypothetical protein